MTPHPIPADLAVRFGLDRHGRGACPSCGYRAALSTFRGRDGKIHLHCHNGCDRDALGTAASLAPGGAWTPPAPVDTASGAEAVRRKQDAALRLFAGSTPCAGTPAALYLARRGIKHTACPDLRYRGDCSHPDGGRRPALVALVRDAAGAPIGAHRTYLTGDGTKASCTPAKATLGPVWGGAVRLEEVAPELVIGEGIETAASAGLLLRLPAWAALSAGNMARGLALPPEVRRVVIAVDRDPPGERAADEAAARWRAEGRHVRLARPDGAGQDFNDVLRDKLAAEVPHG